MTVKELIERLQQCDPEASVTIEFTDATDYLYFYHVGDEYNPIDERNNAIIDVQNSDNPYDPITVDGKAVVINLTEGNAFYGLG